MFLLALLMRIPAAGQTQPTQPQPNAATPSQESPSGEPLDDPNNPTLRVRTDLVNVIFTVTDKHGKFVRDLKQDEFRILDNNLPPKSISSFEAETNLPLRVGLLIDASNSIRDRFQFEQQAAIEFLQQIIRPRSDQGSAG